MLENVGERKSPPAQLWNSFIACLIAERDRWMLWLPVAMGAGVGIYFELAVEPPFWFLWAAPIALAIALVSGWRWIVVRLGLILLLFAALGFSAAQFRSWMVASPMLERRVGPVEVTGRLLVHDETGSGARLILDRLTFSPPLTGPTPMAIRLSVRSDRLAALTPGQRLRVTAMLTPIPAPAAPDSFDYQRFLYFKGVGALGHALSRIEMIGDDEIGGYQVWLAKLRAEMTQRIRSALPGDTGAVAAALITGDRTAISEELEQAMRDSGLTHLLSISGLHISIVAGFVLLVIRGGLALIPWIALRYPIKKWAAAAALMVVFFYCQLAGWTVPIQRAFYMGALVLAAVLIDRNPLSMRMIAWAAVLVLLIIPDGLVGASFQMSFGSVVALIACWERLRALWVRYNAGLGLPARVLLYLLGLALTSIVATIATAPMAAFHFNRVALFGVLANMIAIPISSVPVMPAGLIAALLMPFGLEHLALAPMGWGISIISWIAYQVASWPLAALTVPSFPIGAYVTICLGALWICLWLGRWRWFGLAPILIALGVVAASPGPDIVVAGDARQMALRREDGGFELWPSGRVDRQARTWLLRWGEGDIPERLPSGAENGGRCDHQGCFGKLGEERIAFALSVQALADDCRRATVLISAAPVRRACPNPKLMIDRFTLWRNGAHAIWLTSSGPVARSVRDARGVRPWAKAPEARP
jgi:competence protein ComEC